MADSILEMQGITKVFSGIKALSMVSIEARAGEILAIVGQNGAGKSTLMKILSGAYPYHSYEGSIWIDGVEQHFQSPQDSERVGIAMIYQEILTLLDLSVAENLFLGRWPTDRMRGIRWPKMYQGAKEALDAVGLDVDPTQPVRSLNTSQQQLLCIAAALSRNPRILVLDEPTAALTEQESERLFAILHRLKKRGITSLLISHKLDEVVANADRITVLRDGKSVATYPVRSLDTRMVVKDMVGREISDLYPKQTVDIGVEVMAVEGFSVPHPFNPAKRIVDRVSFRLHQGEILGIAGLVGSGRSELVDAIFGKIRRISGTLTLFGKQVSIRNPKQAIAAGLALLTEDRKVDGFVGPLCIRKNTTLASLKAVSKGGVLSHRAERTQAQGFFQRLEIRAPGIETILHNLSGGNQQKVVLAKWLMTKPRILILDEPTRGIDVGAKYEIYKIMGELVQEGISILLISSDLPELASLSDRLVVLAGGSVKGELNPRSCSFQDIMHFATGAAHRPESDAVRVSP